MAIISFIVEGLTLVSELKDGEILSLDLSDRKWGTANIAGNIALEIPQVIFFFIWMLWVIETVNDSSS